MACIGPRPTRPGYEPLKIIVHCGTNKTGSTAIQDTFAAKAADLRARGVLYPALDSYTHHTRLLFACLADDEMWGSFGRNDDDKRAAGVRQSLDQWDILRQFVDDSMPDTLVLSSEFVFGLRDGSLKRLRDRLAEFSEDIDWIVYLRDPRGHYLSSAQQVLKFGAFVKDPRVSQLYASKYDKFETLFPGRIAARVFDRTTLTGGDVVTDLASYLLPSDEGEPAPFRALSANETLSAEAMALLSEFNREVWDTRRMPGNAISKCVIQAIEDEERHRRYTKPVLRPEIAEVVARVHAADVLALRDRAGIIFPTFDYDVAAQVGDADLADLAAADRYATLSVGEIVDYDPDLLARLRLRSMQAMAKRLSGPKPTTESAPPLPAAAASASAQPSAPGA